MPRQKEPKNMIEIPEVIERENAAVIEKNKPKWYTWASCSNPVFGVCTHKGLLYETPQAAVDGFVLIYNKVVSLGVKICTLDESLSLHKLREV